MNLSIQTINAETFLFCLYVAFFKENWMFPPNRLILEINGKALRFVILIILLTKLQELRKYGLF